MSQVDPSFLPGRSPRTSARLTVSALTPRKVELTWSRPAEDVIGYNLYRAPVQVFSTDQFLLFLDGYLDALIVQDPYQMGYRGVYSMDKVIHG